jgi:hypothetical protein
MFCRISITKIHDTWSFHGPVEIDKLRVTGPVVHYFRFEFKRPAKVRFSNHHCGIHSYTLLSPEPHDMLVGMDDDEGVQEISMVVHESEQFAMYFQQRTIQVVRHVENALRKFKSD